MELNWKESKESLYYYNEKGLIVGHVHKIAHSEIYLGKIIQKNEETILGRFINEHSAKNAVEDYWLIESRTLLS